MSKYFKQGQTVIALPIVLALLSGISSYFGGQMATAKDIVKIQGNIEAIHIVDNNQDVTIREMKENIEYIRRSVEAQNQKMGINVK